MPSLSAQIASFDTANYPYLIAARGEGCALCGTVALSRGFAFLSLRGRGSQEGQKLVCPSTEFLLCYRKLALTTVSHFLHRRSLKRPTLPTKCIPEEDAKTLQLHPSFRRYASVLDINALLLDIATALNLFSPSSGSQLRVRRRQSAAPPAILRRSDGMRTRDAILAEHGYADPIDAAQHGSLACFVIGRHGTEDPAFDDLDIQLLLEWFGTGMQVGPGCLAWKR
jgi:hypothetical protein